MTALFLAVVSALTLSQEVGIAGDYTNQVYGIVDPDTFIDPDMWDTLDVETEVRSFWSFALGAEKGGTRFAAGNDLNLSTRSIREALTLDFGQDIMSNLELELRNSTELCYYHHALPQLADTGFQTDYWSNTSQLELDLDVTPTLTISASEQAQLFRYPQPDSYNCGYLLNRASAGLRQELGGISSVTVDYDWSRRWASAADDQDYVGHDLDVDLDWYCDNGPHLGLSNSVDRRRYASASRSYWEESPSLRLGVDVSPALELILDEEARWTWYDSPTEVYSNLFENRLKLAAEWRATPEFSLRAGPQYDLGRGLPDITSDDYREISASAGFDYMKLDRLWFSVEDRLGRRRYPLADSSFQSDYVFNEFNLMLNWTILKTIGGGLCLNGMVSIAPEWHTDESSDLSTRIFTLELRYGL